MRLNHTHTLYACCTGYVVQAIVNNFLPLLFVVLNISYGISLDKLGLLVTVNFVLQMLTDFFAARFTEKIGYRKLIIFAHISAALGLSMLGLAPLISPDNVYPMLVASIVFYAVGGGLLEVLVSPMVEALPLDNKAGTMSFLHSFYCWGHLGVILVSTAFFLIFGLENWMWMAFLWAMIPVLNGILFSQVPIYIYGSEQSGGSMGRMFRSKIFWLFIVLMMCAGASELAMAQWASYFAEIGLGVSKTVGDLLGPCSFALVMGISRIVYMKISGKVEISKYIILCSILCIFSYLLATVTPFPLVSIIGCALCGFSVGIMWPGILSFAAKKYPYGNAAMFALLALAGDLGCSTGPTVVGFVANALGSTDAAIKAGLFTVIIFPVIMLISTVVLNKIKD